ncbi:MAG: Tad domain-containing protein [Clostridia bacterium]|nr:Tad domain-containing protein [Clostridia bacterium]
MKRFFKSQRGSALVIFGLAAVVLIGFAALVTDVGMMTYHEVRLSNAVDSAALAGAQELIYKVTTPESKAFDYMTKNGYQTSTTTVTREDNGNSIRVTSTYDVKFGLARVLGFQSKTLKATAKGKVLPIIAINNGVRPFAIQDQTLIYGQQYTLKEGGGDGTTGNYGAIELGGAGAQVYYNNIVNGYSGRLAVGDNIETEPGNMSGPTERGVDLLIAQDPHTPKCTYDHYVPNCPRIITIIVVNTLNVNGRATVQIKGFASFFLEGVNGSGNNSEVIGRFIKTISGGDVSDTQTDYGMYGVRLTR